MLVALPQSLHQLVLEQLGVVVVDAQLAPQIQGRDPVLGLVGEAHGEEPSGEGQLSGLEEGAGGQAEQTISDEGRSQTDGSAGPP